MVLVLLVLVRRVMQVMRVMLAKGLLRVLLVLVLVLGHGLSRGVGTKNLGSRLGLGLRLRPGLGLGRTLRVLGSLMRIAVARARLVGGLLLLLLRRGCLVV